MTHTSQKLRFAVLAGALSLALPLAAQAQPGPGPGPGAGPMGGPGMHGMHQGQGMHQGHGMHRGGHGGFEGHGMRGGEGMAFLRGLNLTEAQRDQIFALRHGQAPAMREQGKALHKARQELRQLAFSGQYDEARAKTLSDAIGASMAQMALARTKTANAIYQILTPEQRKQVDERRARFEQGPGMGGPRMGPPMR